MVPYIKDNRKQLSEYVCRIVGYFSVYNKVHMNVICNLFSTE